MDARVTDLRGLRARCTRDGGGAGPPSCAGAASPPGSRCIAYLAFLPMARAVTFDVGRFPDRLVIPASMAMSAIAA